MEQNPRKTRHVPQLDAIRRFSERACAFAQWRRGGQAAAGPSRSNAGPASLGRPAPAGRGDDRSHV